jgi:hypothetical protein
MLSLSKREPAEAPFDKVRVRKKIITLMLSLSKHERAGRYISLTTCA